MFILEPEAKHHWCPYHNQGTERKGFSLGNLDTSKPDIVEHNNCIGKLCAAWRWQSEYAPNNLSGFCGLAGRPQ